MTKTFAVVLASVVGIVFSVQAEELKDFSQKFMRTSHYAAGSRPDPAPFASGYGRSDNAPKAIAESQLGKAGELTLLALPKEIVPFRKEYRGMRLLLVNRTNSEAQFSASDSCINIGCQAQDADGKWKPIENRPFSPCGNSYHHVFLPPGHYWEFVSPIYTGPMKTKLRFEVSVEIPRPKPAKDGTPLVSNDSEKSEISSFLLSIPETDTKTLYSDEFDGCINAEQFTVDPEVTRYFEQRFGRSSAPNADKAKTVLPGITLESIQADPKRRKVE